jgi:hypothetical protein
VLCFFPSRATGPWDIVSDVPDDWSLLAWSPARRFLSEEAAPAFNVNACQIHL